MRRSFFLGVSGGIFSFAMGVFVIIVLALEEASGIVDTTLYSCAFLAFLAGTLGIIGSTMGNRRGGIVTIFSAVLALIATSWFGIPSFILLLVGGVLAYREREAQDAEAIVMGVSPRENRGREKMGKRMYYLGIAAIIVAIVLPMVTTELGLYQGLYLQPRATLTVSMSSFDWTSSDTSSSVSVHIIISNNSPRTANILKDWNLTLVFKNSTFQFPIENCTFGSTRLQPADQTEFLFSYDITNSSPIDPNSLSSMIFTISFIDDQGTRTQQFLATRPHS